MVIYNLADTYFVGMLNDPIQNAAVTLAAPVLLAFNAVNNLFGVGSSSMMSRALGKKAYNTVRRSSAFGFYCALIYGVLFSLVSVALRQPMLNLLGADASTAAATGEYLRWTVLCGAAPAILNVVLAYLVRAEGSALHASIGTMSGCLLNILLDPIFIMPWGLGMGAAGAGLATFLSNCAACVYFFVLLFVRQGRTYVCIDPRAFHLNKAIVVGVCGVGIPAAIQNLLNVTGMTVLNNFTSSFGSDAVAAMGIAQKINMVPLYIALGLSQGIMPLLSYNYGSGNIKRLKQTLLFCVKLSISFMVLVTIGYSLGAEHLVTLFMESLRQQLSAGAVPGHALFVHGFPGGGRVPGLRYGQEGPDFCHSAEDRAGDPGIVPVEPGVAPLRSCLCPTYGGGGSGRGSGIHPAANAAEAGTALNHPLSPILQILHKPLHGQ